MTLTRRQVLVHVVAGILQHDPVHDVRRRNRAQDGVTIGRRARDFRRADRAGGARLVLDDDRLPHLLGDVIAEGARQQIRLPACRVAADHADIARRPSALRRSALRGSATREVRHHGSGRAGGDEMTALEFHGHVSPFPFYFSLSVPHRPIYANARSDGIHLQDQAITESMGGMVDHEREHLAPSDQMITRTRRRLLMAARALRDHGTLPPGVENAEVYRGPRRLLREPGPERLARGLCQSAGRVRAATAERSARRKPKLHRSKRRNAASTSASDANSRRLACARPSSTADRCA